MPRIPKLNKRAIHLTSFPQPMYRSATGEYNRYTPAYAEGIKDKLGLEMVQGPDLPLVIENRRQEMKAAQERFDAELAEERARQAYNRKVEAWNSYRQLPRRERQFWANQDDIEEYLYRMGYASAPKARLATRNPETLDKWAKEKYGVEEYPWYDDSVEFDSFEDFDVNSKFPGNGWGDIPWKLFK